MIKTYLIGMYGFPGSGKTYFSEQLCEYKKWFHLSSDRVRLKMFEEPKYTQEEHRLVFRFMDYLAEELLRKGVNIVYDANFNFARSREKLADIADKTGADYRLVKIETPEEIALERLKGRHETSLDSKKDIYRPISEEVFESLKSEMEELTEKEPVIVVDGTHSFSKQLATFESEL